jgi:hypothetical protein
MTSCLMPVAWKRTGARLASGIKQGSMMRSLLSVATTCVAFVLAGCGNAESIDPSEIDAENARREEARTAEVANAVKAWDANEEIHISGPAALDVGTDAASEAGRQGPDAREKVAPPDGE